MKTLKVHSLAVIIGFAASKQPRNPKFDLDLKAQVSLVAKALCIRIR